MTDSNWETYMKASRGKWTIDPVHNGRCGQDLLVFRPDADDVTCGVYVQLNVKTGRCSAGRFNDAVPHLGDAFFMPNWTFGFPPSTDLVDRVFVRLGLF